MSGTRTALETRVQTSGQAGRERTISSRGESLRGFTIRVFFFFFLARNPPVRKPVLELSLFPSRARVLQRAASTNGNVVAWMRDVRVRCDGFVRERANERRGTTAFSFFGGRERRREGDPPSRSAVPARLSREMHLCARFRVRADPCTAVERGAARANYPQPAE